MTTLIGIGPTAAALWAERYAEQSADTANVRTNCLARLHMKSPMCLSNVRPTSLSRSIPNPGIARLDGGIDEMNALLVSQEIALHYIDLTPLKVVQTEPNCVA